MRANGQTVTYTQPHLWLEWSDCVQMTTTTAPDRMVGRVLGDRYKVTARVGRGGTAVVYRAQDLRLGRDVAVKIIREDMAVDSDNTKRFDREAKSIAQLSHPNVVAIYDQGYDDDRAYIVMEYIGGESIRSVISRHSPLPPLVALRYFDAIAHALAAAHRAGFVHRDIKPENVLIAASGDIKVTDFGLAKASSGQNSASQSILMGTLSYIAPELMTAGVATAASDIYSAGIVLYEMLTGQKPHTSAEPANVLYKHVNVDVPPPSEALAGSEQARIPDYLDALVVACTSRNPALRPPQGGALEEDVAQVRQRLERGIRSDPAFAAALRSRGRSGGAETTAIVPDPDGWDGSFDATAVVTAPLPAGSASSDRTASGPLSADSAATGPLPVIASGGWEEEGTGRGPRTQEMTSAFPDGGRSVQPLRPAAAPPRRARRRGLVALVILIFLGLVGGTAAWWWVKIGRWTEVPPVAGQPLEQVMDTLAVAGLQFDSHDEYSEDVPAGFVISSQPGGAEPILKKGTVELWVSLGPERYPMPPVVGLSQSDAEAAITGGHLSVGVVTPVWDDGAPAGSVLAASEEAQTSLKPGAAIDLTVSKGPEPIPIPDVSGQESAKARAVLEDLQFIVTESEENSREVAAGRVISQNPVAGGTGKHGDTIALTVSLGPVMIAVPDVTDLKKDAAVEKLRTAGFNVDVQPISSLGYRNNRAVATDPEGGKLAAEGSTIVLYVS
ncbi:MAG: PASTA domain-containing protein [Propionibacteriaceae bacterium]|jgi:serine/threonine-protein kinase|nr:PASTA domain-containing protein [Propionibacteriaceae bacterium]